MEAFGKVLVVTRCETVATMCRVTFGSVDRGRTMRVPGRVEAMQMIADEWPDLVVIDWDLADASVVAAAARAAEVPFLTVNDDERAALAGGAVACVPRPFTSLHLWEALVPSPSL